MSVCLSVCLGSGGFFQQTFSIRNSIFDIRARLEMLQLALEMLYQLLQKIIHQVDSNNNILDFINKITQLYLIDICKRIFLNVQH